MLCLITLSCGEPIEPVVDMGFQRTPETDIEAERIVWQDVYMQTAPLPPQTVYDTPDCTQMYGQPGKSTPSGACVFGWAGWPGDGTREWRIWWLWPGDYHRSPLAHELNHVRLGIAADCWNQSNCDPGDSTHSDESWDTLVPQAQRELRDRGL